MKIAICAILRNENLYLREWVEHHKNIGFDKIILYDNNHPEGEYPHQVIGDYVMNGFVEIHNVRGYPMDFTVMDDNCKEVKLGLQPIVYNKCRITYSDLYDWMAFIDIDEFITIGENEPQNIHDIFEKYEYDINGFDQVVMSWYTIGDSGHLNYESKPVQERFTKHYDVLDKPIGMNDTWVKSIVRTNIPIDRQFVLGNEHSLSNVYSCGEYGLYIPCDEYGQIFALTYALHDILYIKHYFSKSLWEHVTRRAVRPELGVDPNSLCNRVNYMRMNDYIIINDWSKEKEAIYGEFSKYISTQEDLPIVPKELIKR